MILVCTPNLLIGVNNSLYINLNLYCISSVYFQDNTIVVWFSNRAGSVDTFAGTSAISYEVQCNDLPSGGVDRTAVNNLAAK